MQTFKISRGEKISVNCTSKIVNWENIINVLSKHKITETKAENGYFVGGEFNNNYRNGENIINRSLVTIDVDKYVGTTDDVLTELQYTLPYKLLAYSTYRNTNNKPRFRIVIPLSSPIPAQDYEPLCRALADEFKEFPFDPCAFKPELAMYMPCTSADYFSEAFTFNKNGDSLDIKDFNIEKYRQNVVVGNGDGEGGGWCSFRSGCWCRRI